VHTDLDVTAFEHKELGRLGMPQGIMMRHRPAHFARKMPVSLPCRVLLVVLCGYGRNCEHLLWTAMLRYELVVSLRSFHATWRLF
jgi:hypothetical protein